VFLNRAWGRWAGFLYAWCEFWVVRPGNIGAMAFIFAKYAAGVLPKLADPRLGLAVACGAVLLLGAINLLGVRVGKGTQSLLTIAKLGGLLAIFIVGLFAPIDRASGDNDISIFQFGQSDDLFTAMVFVLFAYGGWNETAAVAAEVRHPQRNMLRGLLLGTALVIVTYLLFNYSLVRVLGLAELKKDTDAVAATLMSRVLGPWGARLIGISVCISCLGAINGMLFTGARLYYALGRQEPAFAWLGHWNQARGTPVRALVLQTLVALVLLLVFGWSGDGFQQLVMFTTPVFWSFLLLVSLAVVILRWRDPEVARPFRLRLFPLEPLLFTATSAGMIYAGVAYMLQPFHKHDFAFWFSASAMVVPAIVGAIVYVLSRVAPRSARNFDD
jgi:amino acid transporter